MSIFAGAVDYFVKGGPCMWPLLMCSFAAIAIGVERYLFYKKAISGEKFASSFCRMMNDFNLVGASELAEQSKGEAAAMAKEILDIKGDLGQRLETIVYTKADRIIDSLEKNINYLSVVIGLSPMLGLLGTITGFERKNSEPDGCYRRYRRSADYYRFRPVHCYYGYVYPCLSYK